MAFLKFWGKKGKKEEADLKIDPNVDPELEKRRLRHSLSISRSGRFKQKKRERSQISDKPEIFFGQDGAAAGPEPPRGNEPSQKASHAPAQSSYPGAQSRSPKACRDVNAPLSTGGHRVGQSVAT